MGDRDDKIAATPPVGILLRQNLVREIPGQQQDVVRFVLQQLRRREYRQPITTHIAAVFIGVQIDDIVHKLLIYPAVTEQCRRLRRCPIGGDLLPLALEIPEQIEQRAPDLKDATGKIAIVVDAIDPAARLFFEERAYRFADGLAMLHEQPQRSTVDRNALDSVEVQPVAPEEAV